MKKLMLICLFFTLTACAQKSVSLEEINRYSNDMCHIAASYGYEAAMEGKSRLEMQKNLRDMLEDL